MPRELGVFFVLAIFFREILACLFREEDTFWDEFVIRLKHGTNIWSRGGVRARMMLRRGRVVINEDQGVAGRDIEVFCQRSQGGDFAEQSRRAHRVYFHSSYLVLHRPTRSLRFETR
jgi:hypothetical protein